MAAGGNNNNQQQQDKKLRQQIQDLLSGLGLGGNFMHLVDAAIRNSWTSQDFLERLKNSNQFQRMFPGLVLKDGTINPFLGHTLAGAAAKWQLWAASYQEASRGLVPLNDKIIGAAMLHNVSPDEFGARIQAAANVQANPGLLDAFNAELKAFGRPPMDETAFMKFAVGAADRNFYDIYEAAQLRGAGLNLGSATDTLSLARTVGASGQLADISSLIAQIRQVKPDIGPELAAAGVTDADLVQIESGYDPKGLTQQLQGIVANRRATGTNVIGSIAHRTQSGGVGIYPDEAAYAAD